MWKIVNLLRKRWEDSKNFDKLCNKSKVFYKVDRCNVGVISRNCYQSETAIGKVSKEKGSFLGGGLTR